MARSGKWHILCRIWYFQNDVMELISIHTRSWPSAFVISRRPAEQNTTKVMKCSTTGITKWGRLGTGVGWNLFDDVVHSFHIPHKLYHSISLAWHLMLFHPIPTVARAAGFGHQGYSWDSVRTNVFPGILRLKQRSEWRAWIDEVFGKHMYNNWCIVETEGQHNRDRDSFNCNAM